MRLLNVSKAADEEFQQTLERYAVERFLVRIVSSPHQRQFVLKGATLYPFWTEESYRPTRDLDLLGELTPDERVISAAIREIGETAVEPDGLKFDADSIEASKIREDQRYGGIRVLLNAYLGKARIRVQIDVGFGDVITRDRAHSCFRRCSGAKASLACAPIRSRPLSPKNSKRLLR